MHECAEELADLLLSRFEITRADDRVFPRAPRLPAHAPTSRLILVTAGRIQYRLGTQEISLKQCEVILVPAWSVRGWSLMPGETCRLTWCEFIVRPPRPGGMSALCGNYLPDIDPPCILRMIKALDQHNYLLAEGELKALLARVFSHGKIVGTPTGTRQSDPIQSAEAAIETTLSWLHQHYTETFSLDELADKAGLSPRQFRQQFAALVGTPPRQYVTALRMYDAKFRLRSTNQSVKQVALAVGYTDPLYFSRHYKQYWGHAPGKRNV